jgi:hypothetical protein
MDIMGYESNSSGLVLVALLIFVGLAILSARSTIGAAMHRISKIEIKINPKHEVKILRATFGHERIDFPVDASQDEIRDRIAEHFDKKDSTATR